MLSIYFISTAMSQCGSNLDYNSFPANGNFCHLLISFANSLDPDQARQNVGPDLDPNCLTDVIPERFFFEKN